MFFVPYHAVCYIVFRSSTPKTSVFTGSMQLMAAVKLSTERAITNHPHYENKFLRQRTKEVLLENFLKF